MKQEHLSTKEKLPYVTPALQAVTINPTSMLAVSGTPEIRKSDEKVDNNYDALVKGSNNVLDWDVFDE